MTHFPTVTTVALDVTEFITANEKQKAESHLFQFLNGLDDSYASLRSQLLMQNPLPSVETAFSTIQQEESQKDLFALADIDVDVDVDVAAMYGCTQNEYKGPACTVCGQKNHSVERRWTVTGYPKWHRKYKPSTQRTNTPAAPRQIRQENNALQVHNPSADVMLTPQQLQHILNMLPASAAALNTGPSLSVTDDELENCFSGMVSCHMSTVASSDWIIDSGASDHMTFCLDKLCNVQQAPPDLIIKLPTWASTRISHIGNIVPNNGLKLEKVLYVPQFKHNLLSIHKLSYDNHCVVNFHQTGCTIIDVTTQQTRATGTLRMGSII